MLVFARLLLRALLVEHCQGYTCHTVRSTRSVVPADVAQAGLFGVVLAGASGMCGGSRGAETAGGRLIMQQDAWRSYKVYSCEGVSACHACL